jgi:hypothetical protein
MQDNIDVNLIMQAFQEKIGQLMTEIIIKEATIKQLISQTQQIAKTEDGYVDSSDSGKKLK